MEPDSVHINVLDLQLSPYCSVVLSSPCRVFSLLLYIYFNWLLDIVIFFSLLGAGYSVLFSQTFASARDTHMAMTPCLRQCLFLMLSWNIQCKENRWFWFLVATWHVADTQEVLSNGWVDKWMIREKFRFPCFSCALCNKSHINVMKTAVVCCVS